MKRINLAGPLLIAASFIACTQGPTEQTAPTAIHRAEVVPTLARGRAPNGLEGAGAGTADQAEELTRYRLPEMPNYDVPRTPRPGELTPPQREIPKFELTIEMQVDPKIAAHSAWRCTEDSTELVAYLDATTPLAKELTQKAPSPAYPKLDDTARMLQLAPMYPAMVDLNDAQRTAFSGVASAVKSCDWDLAQARLLAASGTERAPAFAASLIRGQLALRQGRFVEALAAFETTATAKDTPDRTRDWAKIYAAAAVTAGFRAAADGIDEAKVRAAFDNLPAAYKEDRPSRGSQRFLVATAASLLHRAKFHVAVIDEATALGWLEAEDASVLELAAAVRLSEPLFDVDQPGVGLGPAAQRFLTGHEKDR